MEEIKRILHEGNYSCVIKNAYGIHTYTQRGVADLYDLYTQKPEYLKDASIADKVIGKGAAALMVLGDITNVYADVISTPARRSNTAAAPAPPAGCSDPARAAGNRQGTTPAK